MMPLATRRQLPIDDDSSRIVYSFCQNQVTFFEYASMRVRAALEADLGWLVRHKGGGGKSQRSWWDGLPYRIGRIAG
jgi:hypothetical protein